MKNAPSAAAAILARRRFAFGKDGDVARQTLAAAPFVAFAALLAARRAGGAFSLPLDVAAAAGYAAATLTVFAAVRAVGPVSRIARTTIVGALVAASVCLTLPGTNGAAIGLVWLPGLAATFAEVALARSRAAPPTKSRPRPAGITAETLRYVDAAGRDTLEGTWHIQFAPGQRIAVVPLSFCPPFERVPEIKVAAPGRSDIQIKATAVFAYAARFEVKLSAAASTALVVALRITAREGLASAARPERTAAAEERQT